MYRANKMGKYSDLVGNILRATIILVWSYLEQNSISGLLYVLSVYGLWYFVSGFMQAIKKALAK